MASRRQHKHVPEDDQGKGRQHDFRGRLHYRGQQVRIGPRTLGRVLATREGYDEACEMVAARIDAQLDPTSEAHVPTLGEFARAWTNERGTVMCEWPLLDDGQRELQDSTVKRLREGVRRGLGEFGHRYPGQIERREAKTFLAGVGYSAACAIQQLTDDYFDSYPQALPRDAGDRRINPFREHAGLSKKGRRTKDPDFRILSADESDRLLAAARDGAAGGAGTTGDAALAWARRCHGLVLAQMTTCARPSELLALRRGTPTRRTWWGDLPSYVDFDADEIWIGSRISGSRGQEGPPKHRSAHRLALPPDLRRCLEAMPDDGNPYWFAGPSGKPMTASQWSTNYWKPIRVAAGLENTVHFYDLKHTAITRLATPKPDGYGIDIRDVAEQAGHSDGGETIRKHYLKLDNTLAIARVKAAFAANDTEPFPTPASGLGLLAAAADSPDLPPHLRDVLAALIANHNHEEDR